MGLWDWLWGRAPGRRWRDCRDPVELVRLARPSCPARRLRQIRCAWILEELGSLLDYRIVGWVDALDRAAAGEAEAEDEAAALSLAAFEAAGVAARTAEADFLHVLGEQGARNEARQVAASAALRADDEGEDAIRWLAEAIREALGRHAEAVWEHAGVLEEVAASADEARAIAEEFRGRVSRLQPRAVDGRLCALVRDVAGDPYRPVALAPAWRTPAAVELAGRIRSAREFGLLSALADRLHDAGCALPAVLGHLGGPGPHARGCWVLRLVLGTG